MHLRKMPLKYWGVVPSQSGPLWLQSVDTMVWGVPAKRRERNSTQEFDTLYAGIRSEGVYISIKFYSILIMKMNCLLTPPLPTVQPSFIAITYGLIVAFCCCRGIPPSDLHGKRPSSFPQSQSLRISSCFYLRSLLPPSSSSVSHALFDCCVCHRGRPSSIIHRPSSIVFRQSSVVSIHRPLSAIMLPPFLPPFLLNIVTIAGLKG